MPPAAAAPAVLGLFGKGCASVFTALTTAPPTACTIPAPGAAPGLWPFPTSELTGVGSARFRTAVLLLCAASCATVAAAVACACCSFFAKRVRNPTTTTPRSNNPKATATHSTPLLIALTTRGCRPAKFIDVVVAIANGPPSLPLRSECTPAVVCRQLLAINSRDQTTHRR